VSQDGPPYSNKAQRSFTVSTPKNNIPLKPAGQQGLIPTTNSFKKKGGGLLINCPSPYNTPILAILKGPNKWRLVQDLWLINKTVIPLHPIAPNPYTLLAQTPSRAQYYSVLDLKDAFFCIPKSKVFNIQEYTQN
jgi:hypothetical protein